MATGRGDGHRAPDGVAALADATPPARDRLVDAVRAAAIVVVILWHCVGSLTHRGADGVVVMPNPVDAVPMGWAATWVLQVMPAFFVVGGFADLAGWDAAGHRAGVFLRRRARRLLVPVAVWVGAWIVVEGVATAAGASTPLVAWFPGVLTPLWFLGVYALVTALVPVTAGWHRRAPAPTLGALVLAVAVAEALRVAALPVAGWLSSALVWVLVHQLGYLWRDRARVASGVALAVAGAGLGLLVVLTGVLGYPRTMVGANLWPTTPAVAALAVLQLGLVALVAPAADRLLRRRRPWRWVVAVNATAMTLFVWHMTAFAAVFLVVERLGAAPGGVPDAAWVLARPFWLVAPAVVLAVLVAAFRRAERW
ncbi:acyltransferase family protein [Actinomycetospora straminea]|uniref:Acyltransferase 3 domain-containing protein n=1 Tax=Actinomycetospora straminea TaxID=663607 RepID=A0ABP9EYW9_9PSEU|nr:acyltransferase family protein [Actinomycetospora straminea]MDD7935431.1 acyltransferase family protein [Actinomycetospora straminea]